MLAVDLDRLGADFWVGNLHKWCCAPRGTAVLHAAERWRPTLRPLVASWGEADGFPLAFDDTGTEDPTAWLSAPRALRVLERLGLDRLRRHNVELAVAGQLEVAEALDVAPADLPRDAAVSMQLVPLPEGMATSVEDADALQDRIGDGRPSRSPSRPGPARGSSGSRRTSTTRPPTTAGSPPTSRRCSDPAVAPPAHA